VQQDSTSSELKRFSFPPRRYSSATIIRFLIAFVAAINLGISATASLEDRFGNNRRPRELKLYADLDNVFQRLSQQSTPIFLKFGDLTGSDIGFASTIYFRAVFTMFPNPVVVGDPSTSLFFAADILPANIDRNDGWLIAHHIGIVLAIRLDNGKLLMTPRRVNAPSSASILPPDFPRLNNP
jgi:hypothetical protein